MVPETEHHQTHPGEEVGEKDQTHKEGLENVVHLGCFLFCSWFYQFRR